MERRVLIAIFLSFIVLYLYQAMVVKPVPKPVEGAPVTSPAASTTPANPAGTAPARPTPAAAPTPSAPSATTLVGDSVERDVRVETRDVLAVFTNRGARLKSWRLKHFFNAQGQPLELVATALAATHPLPFSLRTPDDAITATLNGALYQLSGAPAADGATATATDLKFEYRDSAGIHATKEFHLEPASYIIGFRAAVASNDRTITPTVQWGPALGDVTGETSRYIKKAEGITFSGGKVQRYDPKTIAKQPTYTGDFAYAGVDDHYFMTVALFPGQSGSSLGPSRKAATKPF